MATQPRRKKVWLMWHPEDTARVLVDSELDHPGRPRLLPTPVSAEYRDLVQTPDGTAAGLTHVHGYTVNIGGWISVASIGEEHAVDGTQLEILWGDHDGGAGNPFIPDHTITRIRATVRTTPPTAH
ncbi:hypothetical protein [Microbacterium elymi]|uniref:Uncharacterized protein n=1 Tax=Microbacterium elymi TaxID=2909587 RepID=A0ABY5NHX9_9MICO|nr:hypothetical protein [Microbacterium elymi]UUT34792.1 hypothetical protein L2X98_30540 [Microbacterium elymi]